MAPPESHFRHPLFVSSPESLWADDPLVHFIASEPLSLTRTYCRTLKFAVSAVRSPVFLFVSSVLDQSRAFDYVTWQVVDSKQMSVKVFIP